MNFCFLLAHRLMQKIWSVCHIVLKNKNPIYQQCDIGLLCLVGTQRYMLDTPQTVFPYIVGLCKILPSSWKTLIFSCAVYVITYFGARKYEKSISQSLNAFWSIFWLVRLQKSERKSISNLIENLYWNRFKNVNRRLKIFLLFSIFNST